MNFRKLITYLTMGTAAAMPLAVAQNPTILQGNYISNVFGNSNFVLNPNALTNTANVTVSNATVTRSTTTPLVATSEFLVTVTSANGTIAWNTRTFDQGMKGQNCEARFTYRGFQSTSVAQVRQGATVAGANVVARLALTASTDPRIASINFPCGDLSQPTYFVITDTATLSGTHEIGGAYVGLATNMANVAQAEEVGSYTVPGTTNCLWASNSTTGLVNFAADADCATGTVTGAADTSAGKIPGVKFNNLKPGKYMFVATHTAFRSGILADAIYFKLSDGTTTSSGFGVNNSTTGDILSPVTHVLTTEYTTVTSPTVQVQAAVNNATNFANIPNGFPIYGFKIVAYRFPSSSELVVTPERQGNWYVNAYHDGANIALSTATVSSKTEMTNASLTLKPVANSQPVATLCASGNNPPAVSTGNTTCSAGNESLGITFNIPSVGGYEVCATFSQNTKVPQNGYTDATFSVEETSTSSSTNLTDNPTVATFTQISSISDLGISNPVKACSNFNFTSIGQKAVRLLYRQNVSGTVTTNQILADATLGRGVIWSVVPLSTQSNSALYVQGPVQAAATGAAIGAGSVGEVKRETRTRTAAIALTSGTAANITSNAITLTPGVWMISAGAGITGTATSISRLDLSISTTSATHSGGDDIPWLRSYNNFATYNLGNGDVTGYLPPYYVNITTNTTYYAVIGSIFSGGNAYAFGYIQAVRVN